MAINKKKTFSQRPFHHFKKKFRQGFNVLELAVVMLIISVIAGTFIKGYPIYKKQMLVGASQQLQTYLQTLRYVAITSGMHVKIVIQPHALTHQFKIPGGNYLPTVKKEYFRTDTKLIGRPSSFLFNENGTTVNTLSIILENDVYSQKITLNLMGVVTFFPIQQMP